MQFDLLEIIQVLCRLLAVPYEDVIHSGKYQIEYIYKNINNKFYGIVWGDKQQGTGGR